MQATFYIKFIFTDTSSVVGIVPQNSLIFEQYLTITAVQCFQNKEYMAFSY